MTPSEPVSDGIPMDGLSAPSGVSAQPPEPPAPTQPDLGVPPPAQVATAKRTLLLLLGLAYAAYFLWNGVLVALLPDPTGKGDALVSTGVLTSLVGAIVLILSFLAAFQRISRSRVSVSLRRNSLIKAVLFVLPGLVVSAMVPFLITREPAYPLDIVQPTRAADLVAPVAVTFSMERAADIVRNLGRQPVKYAWDTDGDGTVNEETVTPGITVLFERQGIYTVTARMILDDQTAKRASRRFTIPQAVFSVVPVAPVVERPVRFSIAHLVADPKSITEVVWEYGDGTKAETTTDLETVHTYYAVGEYTASSQITLANNTRVSYQRTITVTDPPPLPFPVTMTTEPKNLIGPPPFGALMEIQTDEPVREIHWQFGDGREERGADLRRVGHSYDKPGIYPVITRIRHEDGRMAELTTIIRVSEQLPLPDLTFEGEPRITSGGQAEGEAPLSLTLTPKTGVPLVRFSWEAPDTFVTVNGETVSAVYREEGSYSLTLVAEGADGKVMRMPIRIAVRPASAQPTILVKPDGGVAPLSVQFDASQSFVPETEQVAGYKWSFGDGSADGQSGPARVEHLYERPGDYTVTLKIVLASGREFTATRKIVVRRPALRACLTTSRLRVQAGRGVEFDAACSAGAPTGFVWDVRYAPQPDTVLAQSTQRSYVHVFETPGEYTVTLTVRDQWDAQDQKSVTITVTPSDQSSS